MRAVDLFWLAPALPLAAFALLAAGIGRFGRLASGLAIAAVAGSAVVSGASLAAVTVGATAMAGWPWLSVGRYQFALALWLEPLGAVMVSVVSGVALVVFVYAASYLADDPRLGRFFTVFSLFVGAMLVLVLAGDVLTLFIAWELVGVCSYLLIGFWFERPGAAAAATKAFLITRLGDLLLLLGLLLLVSTTGQGEIPALLAAASRLAPGLLLPATLLIFAGAAAKSAQLPFQGWLPDAMAGPTPVSALLHSATMVAAGVFLVARLYLMFAIARPTLVVVAWTGAATALLGGLAALVEPDLKRALAYSTMSQIGLMFVGLGAGSMAAAVLLLVAQALYKATLFLAAGVLDHAVGGTAFERMGGLARRMPLTFLAFAISTAALAGLPVTLALPPKDPVLAAAWRVNPPLFAAALGASFITALYSARLVSLVFLGEPSQPARNPQPAKRGLLIPVLVMAALIPVGLLADSALLERPLSTVLQSYAPDVGTVTTLALGVAVLGVGLGLAARRAWPGAVVWPPLRRAAPVFTSEVGLRPVYGRVAVFSLLACELLAEADRRFFDPIGEWSASLLRRVVTRASEIDRRVFDPLGAHLAAGLLAVVRGAGHLDRAAFDALATKAATATLAFIHAAGTFDLYRVEAAYQAWAAAVLRASERLRNLQTGRIENYLLGVFVWGLGLVAAAVVFSVMR